MSQFFNCFAVKLVWPSLMVLVTEEEVDSKKLEELRRFCASMMSEKWLPQIILFMKDGVLPETGEVIGPFDMQRPLDCAQDIPKGSTGKPARIGLAKRMQLEALDINKTQAVRALAKLEELNLSGLFWYFQQP